MYEKKLIIKFGFVVSLIIVALSCARHTLRDSISYGYTPPGTIQINDSVFIDQYEVSNITYREFLFSMKNIFGKNSLLYTTMIPQSDVWSTIEYIECGDKIIDLNPATIEMLEGSYHRAYMFNDFPVVGVSFQQAKNFCTWRTDAVNAHLLIQAGLISPESRFDFTLIDYLNLMGEQKRVDSFQRYPVFLLPTREILEELEYLDNFDSRNREMICEALQNDEKSFFMLTKNQEYNKYGAVANLSGNLAEMSSENGIAYGGSWINNESDCRIFKTQPYDTPSAWLGFRCAVVMMNFQQVLDFFQEAMPEEEVMISKF